MGSQKRTVLCHWGWIVTTAAVKMAELAVWEPSQEARENHAPPREGLSAMGSGGIGRNHRGLVRKVEEGEVGGSTRRLRR